MSIKYYWHVRPACECCKRPCEPIIIGTSSAGWCFALNVDRRIGVNSLDDWKELFAVKDSLIVSEYGDKVLVCTMLKLITGRSWYEDRWNYPPNPDMSWREFHAINSSERGPRGLLRRKVDASFRYAFRIDGSCVGHGEGTWDYVIHTGS